jgi:phosphoenolpyruvate-protein phosphotransferase (PTS system enzyme I)
MSILKGKPVSQGYAEGTAVVLDHEISRRLEVPRYAVPTAEIDGEHKRLDETVEASTRDLRQAGEAGPQAASEISRLHERLVQEIAQQVQDYISKEEVNVEQAIEEVVKELARRLGVLKNVHFREREQDIRDVGRRMLGKLAGTQPLTAAALPPSPIIISRELFPSEALELTREGVVAIVTEYGNDTSHTAILARSLGIPAVFGIVDLTTHVRPGMRVLVDGVLGEVTLDPDEAQLQRFAERKRQDDHAGVTTGELELHPPVTRDGVGVTLRANIGRPEDVQQVRAHHLEGVGLFRTEFLFLEATDRPTYESQVEIYERTADALNGEPLVIRTFDFGDDKIPWFLARERDVAVNRGLRGLQFSLAERKLLETQLRAIARAAQGRNIRVLFPMVVGGDDLRRAREILALAVTEVGAGKMPLVGAMIETPSALFSLEAILERTDFVAIGTNDLTQYMLAVDRDAPDPSREYTAHHPSILRAIQQVVAAARGQNHPVCVCGEDAADPAFACLLVGLGVRELSMTPARAGRVRHALARLRVREAEEAANRSLRRNTPEEVREMLVRFNPGEERSDVQQVSRESRT